MKFFVFFVFGFDLLGEIEFDIYENSFIILFLEKEILVKLFERKDVVVVLVGNGLMVFIIILYCGLLLYSCSFDINGLFNLYLLIIFKKNIDIMVGKKFL